MELLNLIGDFNENFYQLGLIDRERAKDVHHGVKSMLSTPWKPVNKLIEEASKVILKNTILKKPDKFSHLQSYSEGLGIKLEETMYTMLIPELVSCMSKWAPGVIKGNLGCSSFFMRNEKSEVVHGRILDFPLQNSYDLYERAVLYNLKGMPKTLGFGTSGIPYPSITLMTEDGITLALHQKFTNVFNKDGTSIFELIFDLIKNANDKKSTLEYLRAHESITTWCLCMTFKNGDALVVDIMGKNSIASEVTIPDQGVLYYCNHLVDRSIVQEEMLPTGFHQYNLMREQIAEKKIEQFVKKKHNSETELIRMMATPYEQKFKKPKSYEHYLLDTITPSSLAVMTMNPTAGTSLYIDGPAPKIYQDNLILLNDCFKNPFQKNLKNKNHKKHKMASNDYVAGLSSLIKAQKGFDQKDPLVVYHELQFAVDHLEHYLEKGVAEFYFLIAQYIFEKNSKVLMILLMEFKNMEGNLPQTLNDHCLLFIARLERIHNIPQSIEADKIIHPKLHALYFAELKIPQLVLHLTTKNMMVPRIDLLDIIYLHIS